METFFNIFESYGLTGIIVGFICMILFFLIKYYGNRLSDNMTTGLEKVGTKLSEQMSEQNKILTNVIIEQQNQMLKHLLDEKKHEVELHNHMIADKEDLADDINMYLKDIMNVHNSQRAYILAFHNHNENLSGVPFVKFTCKYEWFEQGYDPLINTIKDMAFGSLARIVKDVRQSENQCIAYTDLDKFREENPSIDFYIKNNTTKCLVFKGLYDKNNILIALLVLEYNYSISTKNINFNKLHVQAAELTQLINLRYKYE